MIRILGIDPGYGRLGYGIIDTDGRKSAVYRYGCIETHPADPHPKRLFIIAEAIDALVREHAPQIAAVEELFFAKNTTTALRVAEARGVVLATLFRHRIRPFEYTPLQVKQAITGYGRAEKGQIERMVQVLLQMPPTTIQDDAADALAVALTCASSYRFDSQVRST